MAQTNEDDESPKTDLFESNNITKPKTKIVVHLGSYLTQSANEELRNNNYNSSNQKSLLTPENSFIDMAQYNNSNNNNQSGNYNNFVLNHNYNSISYINIQGVNPSNHKATKSNNESSRDTSIKEKKSNSKQSDPELFVLQAKSLSFPVKIRPEYEIYQTSFEEKVFKNNDLSIKYQKMNANQNNNNNNKNILPNKNNINGIKKNKQDFIKNNKTLSSSIGSINNASSTTNNEKISILSQAKAYDLNSLNSDSLTNFNYKYYEKLPSISNGSHLDQTEPKNTHIFHQIMNNTKKQQAKNEQQPIIKQSKSMPQRHKKLNPISTNKASPKQSLSDESGGNNNNSNNVLNTSLNEETLITYGQHINSCSDFREFDNSISSTSKKDSSSQKSTSKQQHHVGNYPINTVKQPAHSTNFQKSYDAHEFAISLTNVNSSTYNDGAFVSSLNQPSQIFSITEDVSNQINKIIKNYPSIRFRRCEKDKKRLPRLDSFLNENHIKYDMTTRSINFSSGKQLAKANNFKNNSTTNIGKDLGIDPSVLFSKSSINVINTNIDYGNVIDYK